MRGPSFLVDLRLPDEDFAHPGGEHLTHEDQRDDREQDRGHEVVVEALERGEERAPDAAMNLFQWDRVATVLFAIFTVVVIAEVAVTQIRKRII